MSLDLGVSLVDEQLRALNAQQVATPPVATLLLGNGLAKLVPGMQPQDLAHSTRPTRHTIRPPITTSSPAASSAPIRHQPAMVYALTGIAPTSDTAPNR